MAFFRTRSRLAREVTGTIMLGGVLALASASTGTTLRATQDEPAVEAATEAAELKVPADISEESIEYIDPDLAKAVGPQLETLFDGSQSSEGRKAAAAEILKTIGSMSTGTMELESLQRRLARRALLLRDSILATEVADVNLKGETLRLDVTSAAVSAEQFLNRVRNGGPWVDYLHLGELKNPDPAKAVLEQVLKNLSSSKSMSASQLSFVERPELQQLKAAIESSLAADVHAGNESDARAELQKQVHALVLAMLAYEKEPLSSEAERARSAWRVIRSRFPAAADALRPVLNQHYFNHNLHFTFSENLLSRLISDYRTENGCVADCILGAWVTGSQTTSVDVSVDIKPSPTNVNFDLKVSGNTRSDTKAEKSPATVFTSGNHYFWMNRSVFFDGRHISATTADFSADPNSRTVGLKTKFDGIPIIRGIVRNIAMQQVEESKPQSDAITVSRLRNEALPKFQSETDQQFTDGNQTLSKMFDSLERRGVAPDSISARSSDTHAAVSTRTIGIARLGGSNQPLAALTAAAGVAQVHETVLNNLIDVLDFQGREIAEADVGKEFEAALSELLQREVKLGEAAEPAATPEGEEPEPPTVFLFSKTDPIRVKFEKGQIVVVLRIGVRQEGREEIPEQIVTIPITMTLDSGKLILDPGTIGVASREETDRRKQQARAVQMKRILSRRIVRKEVEATFDLQAAGDRTLPVSATHIKLIDGWLTAEFQ